MRNQHRLGVNFFQALSGVIVPGRGIRLLVVLSAISHLFETRYDIAKRIAFLRKKALTNIEHREIFVQQSFVLEQLPSAYLLVATISLLVAKSGWHGGWFMFLVPIGQEELFARYMSQTQNDVIAGLRAERASGGSFS
jgi:hypothetical protein